MKKQGNESTQTFFLNKGVNKGKDKDLKNRLQTIIKSKGMSEADFYNSIGLSRQYWYFISWGIWKPNEDLMFKISRALDVDSRLIFQEEKNGLSD